MWHILQVQIMHYLMCKTLQPISHANTQPGDAMVDTNKNGKEKWVLLRHLHRAQPLHHIVNVQIWGKIMEGSQHCLPLVNYGCSDFYFILWGPGTCTFP